MGTLEKKDVIIKFDCTVKQWPAFKEAMTKWSDTEGFSWALDIRNCICAMLQLERAAAAKKTQSRGRGTNNNNRCLLVYNPCILFCQYPQAVI